MKGSEVLMEEHNWKFHQTNMFRDPNNDHGNKKEKNCIAFGTSECRVAT